MANFEALFGPAAGSYQPPQAPNPGGIPGLNLGATGQPGMALNPAVLQTLMQRPPIPPALQALMQPQSGTAPSIPPELQALMQRPVTAPRFDQLRSRFQAPGMEVGMGLNGGGANPMIRQMLMRRLGLG